MPRVCHLIDASADTAFFRALAERHDRDRFPIAIGSCSPAGALQAAMRARGVPTFSLDVALPRGCPLATLRLARLLESMGADLVHAHCFWPTAIALPAARLAGRRFVFTRHHSDHNSRLGKRWHVALDAACARHADRVIAVSEATRRILVEEERVPAARVTVVYNGAHPLAAPADGGAGLFGRLGLDPGAPLVVTLARLHEEKGLHHLVAAAGIVRLFVPAVRFVIAGVGPEQASLEAAIRARGLEDVVRLVGFVDPPGALVARAWLVALPSLAESFGFAALEAASLGVPAVVSDTGGLPEVVLHEATGLIVKKGEVHALALAIVRLLTDRALATRLGAAARVHAGRFTVEAMVRGYEAVYREILG